MSERSERICCYVTLVLGSLVLLLGLVLLIAGQGMINKAILQSMALTPDSDRLQSWLDPPVQAHLEAYGFDVTNPEAVMQGRKPILREVGPFIYKAVTVKDSVDLGTENKNIKFNDDGETLTYRPRKFYFLDLEASAGDPSKTFITVPNIPFLTVMHKARNSWLKGTVAQVALKNGHGHPFINVSFSGLLWGYDQDELPCYNLPRPAECGAAKDAVDIFNDDDDDSWEDDDDWKRRKREVESRVKRHVEAGVDLRHVDHDGLTLEKAAYVDCKCEWGLFRDRNVTLRKPVRINHGMGDLSKKGEVVEYNDDTALNWWQPGSYCDKVGGQDGGTLPPLVEKSDAMELFIDLMCRKVNLEYEQEVEHAGLNSLRFIAPANTLGSHDDDDPDRVNKANECFCLKDDGFSCFKSGVLNLAPCKRSESLPEGAPIALSFPHFYQSHPSFREAVGGMMPEKEKHQFYVDISPQFGFPLAIRPRFQLNAVIRGDSDIEIMRNFPDELVLPFLWAQDGFSEPSEEMAEAIKFGLSAPKKISFIGGALFLLIGGGMCLVVLMWWWRNIRNQS